jgi:phosphatidylglycerol lysyltransferase
MATPSPEELRKAAPIAFQAADTLAQMVLTGDKFVLFSPTGKSFLTYGIRGRTWVALGGPYGDPSEAHALAWRFRELCDANDARAVFYQVAASDLPLCLDLGLTLVKLGEEAHVPLVNFSLEGKKNKDLRLSRNRAQREGLTFEILLPGQVAAHLGELRAVSDAWLAAHKASEKGFSLGFFSDAYLVQTRCAVVRHERRIVGFANILESGDRKELSVDLMRHNSGDLHGVMDFLFAELLLWGSAQGFQLFNLGMAPLSGLESHPLAPVWHRIGSLIFRHGEAFYNFTGLRQYKEKFHPHWQPRYLASPGGVSLPYVLLDVAALISGGLKEIVSK